MSGVLRLLRMFIISILKIALGVYIGLCILIYLHQSHLVYYPEKAILLTPSDIGLKYDDVSIPVLNHEQITGWYVPAERAHGTILICHGNAGNIGDRLHTLKLFHNLCLNVFIFDYRGYGNSPGKPSEKGTYQDALAAWNYLTDVRQIPATSVILFGRSLGAAVAAWLAEREKPAGLVLESTFTSVPDLGRNLYPYLPIRLLSRYSYNTLRLLGQIKCPVLIAHSKADEIIPFQHSLKLYDAAPEPKMFFELSGMHNEATAASSSSYLQTLDMFLSQCLKANAESEHYRNSG